MTVQVKTSSLNCIYSGHVGHQTAKLVFYICVNVGVNCVLTSIWSHKCVLLVHIVWCCDNAVSYLYVEKCFWSEKPWATKKGQPVSAKKYNTPMEYHHPLVDPIKCPITIIISHEPHDLNATPAGGPESIRSLPMQGTTKQPDRFTSQVVWAKKINKNAGRMQRVHHRLFGMLTGCPCISPLVFRLTQAHLYCTAWENEEVTLNDF